MLIKLYGIQASTLKQQVSSARFMEISDATATINHVLTYACHGSSTQHTCRHVTVLGTLWIINHDVICYQPLVLVCSCHVMLFRHALFIFIESVYSVNSS